MACVLLLSSKKRLGVRFSQYFNCVRLNESSPYAEARFESWRTPSEWYPNTTRSRQIVGSGLFPEEVMRHKIRTAVMVFIEGHLFFVYRENIG